MAYESTLPAIYATDADEVKIFNRFKMLYDRGCHLGAAMNDDMLTKYQIKRFKDKNNLYNHHAYSITGVFERNLDGEIVYLVRILNPHGQTEKGEKTTECQNLPFNDDSKIWKKYPQ